MTGAIVSIETNTNGHASDMDFSQLAKKSSYDTPLISSIAADTSIAVEHDINTANANDFVCLNFTLVSSFIYRSRVA